MLCRWIQNNYAHSVILYIISKIAEAVLGSLMGCRPELGFALVLVVGMVIHKVGSLHRMCLHPSKVEIMASWLNEGI